MKTSMRSKEEIKHRIREVKAQYNHVLRGSLATVQVNAPRALLQVQAEAKLATLHWVLLKDWNWKPKGINT